MTENQMIASFRSRQAVIRLKQQMDRAGIAGEIVSTPRAVAIGCGLSAGFSPQDFDRVKRLTRQGNTATFLGFYHVQNGGGSVRVTPAGW